MGGVSFPDAKEVKSTRTVRRKGTRKVIMLVEKMLGEGLLLSVAFLQFLVSKGASKLRASFSFPGSFRAAILLTSKCVPRLHRKGDWIPPLPLKIKH